eukprot:SAG31_NODE_114_length_24318_cov_16.787481_8_plen_581_part_00
MTSQLTPEEIRANREERGLIDLDIERLEQDDAYQIEGKETNNFSHVPVGPIKILWTIQTSCIIVVIIALGAMFWQLKFVMVPTLMAYFFTYMMGPFMDLLEKRPFGCFGPCGQPREDNDWDDVYGAKMLCVSGYEDESRAEIVRRLNKSIEMREHHGANADDGKLAAKDCVLMAKFPHAAACGLTLLGSFSLFSILIVAIQSAFNDYAAEDARRVAEGKEGMSDAVTRSLNELLDDMNTTYGIFILKDENCLPNTDPITVYQEEDANNNYILNTYVYGFNKAESAQGEYVWRGANSNTSCDTVPTFPMNPDGTPLAELMASVSAVGVVINDVILMLLLAVFILLERPEGATFKADHKIMFQIEEMVKNYISLKTLLSLGTGIVVGMFLLIGSVKLWIIWGLLAFLLNYIPNVGSMIAMILPLPFIFLDTSLDLWQQAVAAGGMVMTEMYVGNALEPAMFGASLNLTEISVLLSLVFCSYLWGLYGAVLSVPLLGIWKIVAHNVDHPMAKGMLKLIRADAEVDKQGDKDLAMFFDKLAKLDARLDDLFSADKAIMPDKSEPKAKKEKKKKEEEEAEEEAQD